MHRSAGATRSCIRRRSHPRGATKVPRPSNNREMLALRHSRSVHASSPSSGQRTCARRCAGADFRRWRGLARGSDSFQIPGSSRVTGISVAVGGCAARTPSRSRDAEPARHAIDPCPSCVAADGVGGAPSAIAAPGKRRRVRKRMLGRHGHPPGPERVTLDALNPGLCQRGLMASTQGCCAAVHLCVGRDASRGGMAAPKKGPSRGRANSLRIGKGASIAPRAAHAARGAGMTNCRCPTCRFP